MDLNRRGDNDCVGLERDIGPGIMASAELLVMKVAILLMDALDR